jgi:hypothetical protein
VNEIFTPEKVSFADKNDEQNMRKLSNGIMNKIKLKNFSIPAITENNHLIIKTQPSNILMDIL